MLLNEFVEKLQGVRRSGGSCTAKCPAHEDTQNSLGVSERDGKILIKCYAGCDTKDVLASLGLTFRDLFINPSNGSNRDNRTLKRIAALYDYRDDDGTLLYQVVRYDPKEFRQRRPDPNDRENWLWNLTGVNRVLYRLPELIEAIQTKTNAAIFVVEGEKDADNLAKLGLTATTNAGGAAKWNRNFNDILSKAFAVFVLPDNDIPGRKHARVIVEHLSNACIVELPGLTKPGADVSDWITAGGTREQLQEICLRTWQRKQTEPPSLSESKSTQDGPLDPDFPVIPLGFRDGKYTVYVVKSNEVRSFPARELARDTTFMEFEDLSHWEVNYKSDYKGLANMVVQASILAGPHDSNRVRGRGAWLDNDNTILHCGDHLLINGARAPLGMPFKQYVYPVRPKVAVWQEEPMSIREATEFFQICQILTWTDSILSPYLLAGWAAVAPICGALHWRPHLWLTGATGCGKTWVLRHIISPLLGDILVKVALSTTEAGLRQHLGCDALPVAFDEAGDQADQQRRGMPSTISKVLELARASSADSGTNVIKGSAGGEAMYYLARSCFLFAAILPHIDRAADASRITVLELQPPPQRVGNDAQLEVLSNAVDTLLSREYSGRWLARCVRMAPAIISSAQVFSQVIGGFSSRRDGDQLGTLLAGYWSLVSNDPVNHEEATDLVAELPIQDLITNQDIEVKDEEQCLQHILEQLIMVRAANLQNQYSVGELITWARNTTGHGNQPVDCRSAQDILRRHGLLIKDDGLYISTNNSVLSRIILSGTPWERGWSTVLGRLPGAVKPRKTTRFGELTSKSILIPWLTIFEDQVSKPTFTDGDMPF